MATFIRFEEIEAWKTGRELRRRAYALTRKPSFAADRDLVGQIRRAAQSVTSNIAEGHERGGNREFQQFLWIAKGSTAEVQDQLYTAIDEEYIGPTEFDTAYQLAAKASRQIGGLISYLQSSEIRGQKFKTIPACPDSEPAMSVPKQQTRNPKRGGNADASC